MNNLAGRVTQLPANFRGNCFLIYIGTLKQKLQHIAERKEVSHEAQDLTVYWKVEEGKTIHIGSFVLDPKKPYTTEPSQKDKDFFNENFTRSEWKSIAILNAFT